MSCFAPVDDSCSTGSIVLNTFSVQPFQQPRRVQPNVILASNSPQATFFTHVKLSATPIAELFPLDRHVVEHLSTYPSISNSLTCRVPCLFYLLFQHANPGTLLGSRASQRTLGRCKELLEDVVPMDGQQLWHWFVWKQVPKNPPLSARYLIFPVKISFLGGIPHLKTRPCVEGPSSNWSQTVLSCWQPCRGMPSVPRVLLKMT